MEIRRRIIPDDELLNLNTPNPPSRLSMDRSIIAIDLPGATVNLFDWALICVVILVCIVFIPLKSTSCGPFIPTEVNVNGSFQEAFARKHLQYITRLGPRTGGSINNEIHARKYLLSELRKVAQLAEASGIIAEVDEQVARPASFRTHVHVTSYANIPNLLLRLHDPRINRSSDARSILINCHYDTAPQSPGASDAFAGCANSLEVARILAMGETKLLNNVIFLLNSAEENILPASHAFVTQHRWAKEVAVFVNLEGAGAGGKLMVFQSGPGPASKALIKLYSSTARYPSASVVGEEIFRFGLIPSDTDFRIFRDYGRIPGMDFAFIGNGYAYHTRHDIEQRISQSCLQLAGDNLLHLIMAMAKDSEIQKIARLERSNGPVEEKEEIFSSQGGPVNMHSFSYVEQPSSFPRYVYFDVSGFFMLKYPWSVGRLFHWFATLGISVWILASQKKVGGTKSGLFLATTIQALFFITGNVFALIVGSFIHMYGVRMSWYANRFNLFGLYLLPLISYFLAYHAVLLKIPTGGLWRFRPFISLLYRSGWCDLVSLKSKLVENDFFKGGILVLNFLTFIALCFNTPASYLTLLWCLSAIFFRHLYFLLFKGSHKFYVFKVLLTLLPPLLLFHISSVYTLFDVFIPIMGRAGHEAQPDVVIAFLVAFSAMPALILSTDAIYLTHSVYTRILSRISLNGCISFILLIHTSVMGFPYVIVPSMGGHSITPCQQRVAVFHANRFFRDSPLGTMDTLEDSGIFLFPVDTNRFRYFHQPPSEAPNPFMSKLRRLMFEEPPKPYYFPEIEQTEPFAFQHNVPYCGIPLIYPLLNAFDTIYYIPVGKHKSPSSGFKILSRVRESSSDDCQLVNLTLSIHSSAPLTQLYLHTLPKYARLLQWSFAPEWKKPLPVPIPRKTVNPEDKDAPQSAHFYINHIDPSAATSATGRWAEPWVFWLQFRLCDPDLEDSNLSVGVAVVNQFFDEAGPYGKSEPLRLILNRLPQWSVATHWISSYNYTRIRL